MHGFNLKCYNYNVENSKLVKKIAPEDTIIEIRDSETI